MHTESRLIILLLINMILICSCKRPSEPAAIDLYATGKVMAIRLSPKNINQLSLKFGKVEIITCQNIVISKGNLVIPPENIKNIIASLGGSISSISVQKDQFVKKGQVLANIQNIDFITLQEEYLEARNQFEYFREEYTRQGDLTVENATSIKKMQTANRDYQTAELRYNALALKIKLLGINPDNLNFAEIIPYLPVRSNRSGYISNLFVQSGSYVNVGDPLFEIVNTDSLLIRLMVDEQYFATVHKGQLVDCYIASDSLTALKANIVAIDHKIDPSSRMGIVHAGLLQKNNKLIPGMFVTGRIFTEKDTALYIRSTAILKDHKDNYVFAKKDGKFLRFSVLTEMATESGTQIYGLPLEFSDSIIFSGVKRLNSFFN